MIAGVLEQRERAWTFHVHKSWSTQGSYHEQSTRLSLAYLQLFIQFSMSQSSSNAVVTAQSWIIGIPYYTDQSEYPRPLYWITSLRYLILPQIRGSSQGLICVLLKTKHLLLHTVLEDVNHIPVLGGKKSVLCRSYRNFPLALRLMYLLTVEAFLSHQIWAAFNHHQKLHFTHKIYETAKRF